jgi:diketogulonate reductase-like aldo/keto reductase
MLKRTIPKSGEELPVLGLGTWQTFDVGDSERERQPLIEVLRGFAAAGGRLIDSSPMYGRAEAVVGELEAHVPDAFIATKVWTRGEREGIEEMSRSAELLQTPRIDLMQVHNLLDWRIHLRTLRAWQAEGRVRYIGITHYQTSAFPQLESIMESEPIDFVQLPMSVELPDAAARLLPLAARRGIAVIVNRPFEGGPLLRRLRGQPLPSWAVELGAHSWSELLLRWIISHEEVTCVIPATADPAHLADNLRAGEGRLLDTSERRKLRQLV